MSPKGALYWPLRVAAEYALIAAFITLGALFGGLACLAAAFFVGTRQHALAIIGHWASHGLMKHSRAVTRACFIPLGIDLKNYQAIHQAHHGAAGNSWFDHEALVARMFPERWARYRKRDLALDATGMRLDEGLMVFVVLTSPKALWLATMLVLALGLAIGWPALVWPIGACTGLMVARRLRLRTERDRTYNPGALARWWCLPHHADLHAEHHNHPRARVWAIRPTRATT